MRACLSQIKPFFLLAVLIGSAYSNGLDGPFIIDDLDSIRDNSHIRSLWPLTKVFDAPHEAVTLGRRPITHVTFALNYAVHELDVRGYHFINISIHIFAVWALFLISQTTFAIQKFVVFSQKKSSQLAFLISLLWGLHPLVTQAVNYTVQRGELLSGLFILFTLWLSIKYQIKRRKIYFFLGLLTCFLGVGSKENALMIPFIILLYDRIFFFESFGQAVSKRKLFYFCLILSWVLFAYLFTHNLKKSEAFHLVDQFQKPTAWSYLLTQPEVIFRYLKLAFWPVDLRVRDLWPVIQSLQKAILPGLGIVTLLTLTALSLKYKPWLSFLGAWFFFLLAPTSSFYPLWNLYFEHRMYLPLIAIITLFVLFTDKSIEKIPNRVLKKSTYFSAFFSFAALLGFLTYKRNQDYQSEYNLWSDTIKKRPNNYVAYGYLGDVYLREKRYDAAIENYFKAIELNPKDYKSRSNLAEVYLQCNQEDQAVKQLQELARLYPSLYQPHYKLGLIHHSSGHHSAALIYYKEVLKRFSDHVYSLNNLAWLLAASHNETLRNAKESLELSLKACQLTKYQNPSLLITLAASHAELGDFDKALHFLSQSIALDPNSERLNFSNRMKRAYEKQEKIYFER